MKEKQSLKISMLLTILGVVVVATGISFAIFSQVISSNKSQIIQSGKVSFELTEPTSGIELNNLQEMTDYEGLAQEDYYEFSIKNNGDTLTNYKIYLIDDTIPLSYTGTILDDKYIKIGLEVNGNAQDAINLETTNRLIAENSLKVNKTNTYKLRVWLDFTGLTDDEKQALIGQTLFLKIKVIGEQNFNLNLDTSGANEPDLATGMIPVYYDSANDVWRKADVNNGNETYRWYSYTSDNNDSTKGMWANAVTYDRTKVNDESGKNQDGTITGATYTNDGMKFDGTDDIIKAVGTKNYNFGSTITVAARFKISSEDQNEIYSKIVDQLYDNMGFELAYIKESSVLVFGFITTSSTYAQVISPTLEKDIWYTVVGTYNGNILKLYINGNLVASKEVTGNINAHTLGEISVGAQDYTNLWHFKGTISDALVINAALDETTITNNYGTNFNYVPNLNTVFYYNMRDYASRDNGIEIPMSMINTMWVWIPRFSAVTPSGYNGGTAAAPGAIDVAFVSTNTPAIDAFWWDEDSDGVEDTGEQKSGFWFGKFENSATSIPTDVDNTNHTIIIKPNVVSWGFSNISTFFNSTRIMENAGNIYGFDNVIDPKIDTHLTKNNEWAAMAYLTGSIYGRCISSTNCTEVTMNNCSSAITGIGADTITADSSSTTCTQANNRYNGSKGNLASTTGTIYGIYDVSGGRNDYVMGDYNSYLGSSGFASLPESKYYNNYLDLAFIGDALNETASWYGDGPYFQYLSETNPWIIRGGCYADGAISGIFCNGTYGGGTAFVTGGSRTSIVK